ncbi:MAG: serine/threonine-protein kinase [Thermoanaerobaculia bacterium]
MPETQCPSCGTRLPAEPWQEGLCPACLLDLALSPIEEDEDLTFDALTEAATAGALLPGRVLGGRYRIHSLLGRGGMGEVWRGRDLKLRVDVALKAVREDLLSGRQTLETLRREVRTAREVASPNVCRVFDLVEVEGRELASMEYVDGTTLAEVLRERGPLALDEAQEIASQFLAGLAAVHDAGLVHRDLKPENLMLTRAGRVVVMDLGLARGMAAARRGTISGTPPYMPPEQARGGALDSRADVFVAGVVLAEMVDPGGTARAASRRRLWQGLHQDPPQVAETPWVPVIRRGPSRRTARRATRAPSRWPAPSKR